MDWVLGRQGGFVLNRGFNPTEKENLARERQKEGTLYDTLAF